MADQLTVSLDSRRPQCRAVRLPVTTMDALECVRPGQIAPALGATHVDEHERQGSEHVSGPDEDGSTGAMRSSHNRGVRSIDRSVRPGAPVPATVLVAVMSDGSYLLVGYPQSGPSAYVIAEDAVPLREALTAAFGSE